MCDGSDHSSVQSAGSGMSFPTTQTYVSMLLPWECRVSKVLPEAGDKFL